MKKIILASGSPRRKQLLESAGISFEVMAIETNESYPDNLSPREIAIHIARNKALEVKKIIEKDIVNGNAQTIIAADTIVVLESQIIGKPNNYEHAIKILTKLSGAIHKVITGVCILSGTEIISFAEETEVEFHVLSSDQIKYYINNYKPYDKAGAYAIQEWIGIIGVKSIKGDYYNVMALPVSKVLKALEQIDSVELF
ncbi:MAG: Maf family nucleotide pyrophosphatase [Bacteroidota bacterium]|nr:Maf family nucleotide pyrophosphatase [Bacteroidota bacterium]